MQAGAAKPAKSIEPFETGPRPSWVPLLAPGWALHGHDMWEVAAFVAEQQALYPDMTLFAIFEDVDQAMYTSGHAMTHTAMDCPDLSPDDPRVHPDSIDGDYVDLQHPSEFPLRLEGFHQYLTDEGEVSWHGQVGWRYQWNGLPVLLKGSGPTGEAWFDSDVATSRTAFVLRVPVTHAPDAIAVFPNGYFSDDLSPAQNYALAGTLLDAVGLRIFGFGASFVGYRRDMPLSAQDAALFAAALRPLYDDEDDALEAKLAAIAVGETALFIAYGNR